MMKAGVFKPIALLIFIGSVAFGWLWMDFNGFMNSRANIPPVGIDLHVSKGSTLYSISKQLYDASVFRSTFYPKIAARLYPELTALKKGEYFIHPLMSPHEIFKLVASGKVKTYQIQFIEGWTVHEYLNVLLKNEFLKHEISPSQLNQLPKLLKLKYEHLEGLFYPDTYNFSRGDSDIDILVNAHNLMMSKLNKAWQERDIGLPYDNPYEVLIMASIIEKETGQKAERERIAGVFVRRLNMNMKLQTDPTVIYGIGSSFDGNLRRNDLRKDTPYNTYTRRGLPPTPISMPSEASLSAAVHPAEGTELYFVARGDGSHQFSTTLVEHNIAVRQYQLNISN